MKNYFLHSSMGCSTSKISGNNIIDAITNNFKDIAEEAEIGNAAGYRLISVSAVFSQSILGGKGGCRVIITATGNKLAHTNNVGLPTTKEVWIGNVFQDELPNEYIFEIK